MAGVRVIGLGDISFAGTNQRVPSLDLFKGVMSGWAGASLVCANLEGPLVDGGTPIAGKCTLRGSPGWAGVIKAAGINVVSLANNHIMDFGAAGLESTLQSLRSAGISHVGAGADLAAASAPLVLNLPGSTVALFARTAVVVSSRSYAASSEPGTAFLDLEQTCREISDWRGKANAVIVTVHWGIEQHRYPSPEQRKAAFRMADAGACLVLGHHPHVVQGMERIRNAVVAYSLGNFVLDDFVWREGVTQDRLMSLKPSNRIGAMLAATLDGGRITTVSISPTAHPHGGAVAPAATAANLRAFRQLDRRLRHPLYGLLWHLHAARVEWDFRIRPNVASGGLLRKLSRLRFRHFKEIGGLLRRSARVAAGRSTNPYE